MNEVITIDLQKFCGQMPAHSSSEPFVIGGFRYATDAKICIRVPTDDPDDAPGKTSFPPVPPLFNGLPDLPLEPWPAPSIVRAISPCPQCHGLGAIYCGECDEQIEPCLTCNGKKKFLQDSHQVVGLHNIKLSSDKLIRTLPNVRYAAGMTNTHKPLHFVFDGGEGLVMGLPPFTVNGK